MHDEGPPGSSDAPRTDADRRLATVRGLLAKAEATEFAEEAEAFFAKASELIARYAIDEALLWAAEAGTGGDRVEELRLVVHAPYLGQKAVLVDAVARAHGCRAVRLVGPSGRRSEEISVVGFSSELRWVEALVTSLLVQLVGAMHRGSPPGLTASATAGWRRSFIIGFAEEVATRLSADREEAARHAGPDAGPRAAAEAPGAGSSVALVLAARDDEVAREFRRRHPRVRSAWTSSGRSRAGQAAGRAAGREASLTRHRLGGRPALGPGR
jgi:hypothetical protein